MSFEFYFYDELRRLIHQIPEGMVSIVDDLAKALGDKRSIPAILETMEREDFSNLKGKVVPTQNSRCNLFKNFNSNMPLKILREHQKKISKKIIEIDQFDKAELIAGVDVSYKGDLAYSACVVLNKDFKISDVSITKYKTIFPYIPGYLSFREKTPIIDAIKGVSGFDILMVNGHGVAHPRFLGLASHVGLDLDKPTIGVTKRRLVGEIIAKGDSWNPVLFKGRIVGARINIYGKENLYVSVGHKISLSTSVEIVKNFLIGYNLPEPLRIAHILSKNLRD